MTRAGAGFLAAFGGGHRAWPAKFYCEDAVLWTPLTGPLRGREVIADYFGDLHSAFPGFRVALHDEFGSPDGGRACIRVHLDWQNTGPFYGNPPTGETGVMTETHAVRIADGRITEQVVGDSTFQMPHQELVAWQMPFPEHTPDPAPPIASVTAPAPAARQ